MKFTKSRLTAVTFFFLSHQIMAGVRYEKEYYWDSTAHNAYVAPLNEEKKLTQAAIDALQKTISTQADENKTLKLEMVELYDEKENIQSSKQDLIAEYQSQKARLRQANLSLEGLKSLQAVLKKAVATPISEEVKEFIKHYLEAKAAARLIISKDLQRLIDSEIDLEQKDFLLSLQKALAHYGLALNHEPIEDDEEQSEQALVDLAFQKLSTLADNQEKSLKLVFDLFNELIEKQDVSRKDLETNMQKLRAESGSNIDRLEILNTELRSRQLKITQNKNYSATLQNEILGLNNKISALDEKLKLAPAPVHTYRTIKIVTESLGRNR